MHETPERILVTLEINPVRVTGMDEATLAGLRSVCEHAARVRKRVLMDLRVLDLVNELLVDLFPTANRCAGELGVEIRFAVRPEVRHPLTLTHLDLAFSIDEVDPDRPV